MGALFVPVYYVLSDVFRRAQLGTPKTQHLAQKSVNYMTVSFSSCNFRIFSSDHGSKENRLVITGILFSLTLSLSKIYFLYLMFVIPLHENCLKFDRLRAGITNLLRVVV